MAGTASGKTLGIGAPLFYKVEQGEIREVLLIYATSALLEDQQRVMRVLAEATGFDEEVGQLQGGMSRSALIYKLNKRILLATPDQIYWFFRKNVKYNALLAYGLGRTPEASLAALFASPRETLEFRRVFPAFWVERVRQILHG